MQQIHYFLALCEELSFTRAARRCGVAQPSLTTAIGALERELGGALFHRKPAIALTGLGHRVLPYLDEIARSADCAPRGCADIDAASGRRPIGPSSGGEFGAPLELMPLTLGS
jgi:DNA-binding transcriptional LysR family regulator